MIYSYFSKYAEFLLQNHLNDFVREQNQLLRDGQLPLLEAFKHLSQEEMFDLSKKGISEFLQSIIEGKGIELSREKSENWKNGNIGIGKDTIILTDLTDGYRIRKECLIRFLEYYTSDIQLYKKVVLEIEKFHSVILEISLGTFFDVQKDTVLKGRELTETIIDNSDDAIFSFTKDMLVTIWNKTMEVRTGVKREDVTGKDINNYFPDYKFSSAAVAMRRVLQGEKVYMENMPFASGEGYYDAIGSPLFDPDKKICGGVFIIKDITERKKRDEELKQVHATLLSTIAELENAQEALMRSNVELEEKVAARTYELAAINNANKVIAGHLDIDTIVQKVTDLTTGLCKAEFGAFFYNMPDDKGGSYTLYAISGVPKEKFSKFPMPRNTEIFKPTFQGAGIIRSDDITKDIRYGRNAPYNGMPEGHLPVKSYLAVPVISRTGEVLGGLFFGHSDTAVFTAESERLVSSITTHAAIAIDNAKLFSALKASEERFRFVAEAIPQIVWTADSNGVLDYFNLQWIRYTGLSMEESKQKGLNSVIHPDDLPKSTYAWEKAIMTGKTFEIEYRLKRSWDAHYRWHLVRAIAVRGSQGEILKWFGTCTDIHDQKGAQEALQMKAKVLQTMYEGVSVADQNGIIVYTNPAEDSMFGYARGELLGKHVTVLTSGSQEEKDRLVSHVVDELTCHGNWEGEVASVRKDGSEFITKSYITILKLESKNLFVCIQRDITDERKSKKEIEDNNRELNKKNQELTRINNDLDNFIYTASHDLKAPVSNIEGLIFTLKDTLQSLNRIEPEVDQILTMVNASINRFQRTIHDLTEVSKTQKDTGLEVACIHVLSLVDEVLDSITNMIRHFDATIQKEIDDSLIVNFSVVNFRSIVYNLITNAIKYRSPDRLPVIHVHAYRYDEYVVFQVSDNGLGIKEEQKGKMFQMFKRLHDHVEGSGVGLYIVKKIVENTGGRIEVDSEPGRGSTFRVFIRSI